MKQNCKLYAAHPIVLAVLFACTSCAIDAAPSYRVVLPSLPAAWSEILGEPCWRIEWLSPHGRQTLEIAETDAPLVDPLIEWTTPITAYPFWPGRGIRADMMKPAGALFPLDIDGATIKLSWQGGVEAFIYWQLAARLEDANGTPRSPQYFNWPRFRELLADSALNEEVRADLWRVDWELFCQKTAHSGFDRRRITPYTTDPLVVPIAHEGIWLSASPFAPVFIQAAGASILIRTSTILSTYVSSIGILRCQGSAWIFEDSTSF
jgi:hypothetical protein